MENAMEGLPIEDWITADCNCDMSNCNNTEIDDIIMMMGPWCCNPDLIPVVDPIFDADMCSLVEWETTFPGPPSGGDCEPFVGTCEGEGSPDNPDCMLSCDEFLDF